MIRWTLLAISGGAFASLWGVGPSFALLFAFAVMFTNFATFCLLYDRPQDRARDRVAGQLRQMNPHTDVAQRLQSATIKPNAADRQLGYGPMPALNLATGLAAMGLLIWGIVLRVF